MKRTLARVKGISANISGFNYNSSGLNFNASFGYSHGFYSESMPRLYACNDCPVVNLPVVEITASYNEASKYSYWPASKGDGIGTTKNINDGFGLSSGLVEHSAASAARSGFQYGYRGMQSTEAAAARTLTKIATGARYVGLGGAAIGTGLIIYQGYNNGFSNQDIARIGVQSVITGIGFLGPIGFGVGVGLGILESNYGGHLYQNFSIQPRLRP